MTHRPVRGVEHRRGGRRAAVARYLVRDTRFLRAPCSSCSRACGCRTRAAALDRLAGRAPGRSAARAEIGSSSARLTEFDRRRARQRCARHDRMHRARAPPASRAPDRAAAIVAIEAVAARGFRRVAVGAACSPRRARPRACRESRFLRVVRGGRRRSCAPSKRCFATGKPRCGQMRDTQRDSCSAPTPARSARSRWCRSASKGDARPARLRQQRHASASTRP